MGVLQNEVGRPSKKIIIIRNILKVILILIFLALVGAGYFLDDISKEDTNKAIENEEIILDDEDINSSSVINLYSKVKESYYFMEKTPDGIYEFIKSPLYMNGKVFAKDLPFDFKMSMAVNKSDVDLSDLNEISYDDFSKDYYDIFGEKPEKKDFYCYSLDSLGEVKYSNDTYKFKGEYLTNGLEDSDPNFKLVKVDVADDEVYLYEIMYYTNIMESGALNYETVKYFNQDHQNNENVKVVFELPQNSESYNLDEEKSLIENSDKFSNFKWTFTKNDHGNYVFTSVEKVK